MAEQGRRLEELVGRFKLGKESAAPASPHEPTRTAAGPRAKAVTDRPALKAAPRAAAPLLDRKTPPKAEPFEEF
jgi:hypothetical protein